VPLFSVPISLETLHFFKFMASLTSSCRFNLFDSPPFSFFQHCPLHRLRSFSLVSIRFPPRLFEVLTENDNHISYLVCPLRSPPKNQPPPGPRRCHLVLARADCPPVNSFFSFLIYPAVWKPQFFFFVSVALCLLVFSSVRIFS